MSKKHEFSLHLQIIVYYPLYYYFFSQTMFYREKNGSVIK